MDEVAAIHTLARSYLAGRWRLWRATYSRIPRSLAIFIDTFLDAAATDREGMHWTYSDEEKSVFPRYNVVREIVDEVERYVPSDFADLDEARQRLIACGRDTWYDEMSADPGDPVEQAAVAEERVAYENHVAAIATSDLAAAKPIPFRRRLRTDEEQRCWDHLRDRWGVENDWHPDLTGRPDDVEVYEDGSYDFGVFDGVFSELSGGRFFELNRGSQGRSREIETVY